MASGDSLVVFTPLHNEPPATIAATHDVRNGHPVLDFDDTTDEEAVFTGVLPSNYAGGGLTVFPWFALTSATSGTVRVQAAIEFIALGVDDIDADTFAAFQSAAVAAPGTSGITAGASITFTSGAQMDSLLAGQLFRLKIRRDADGTSGTDDATGDAELVAVLVAET